LIYRYLFLKIKKRHKPFDIKKNKNETMYNWKKINEKKIKNKDFNILELNNDEIEDDFGIIENQNPIFNFKGKIYFF
jgi:hypothetical protein